jgi:hypothetical protein
MALFSQNSGNLSYGTYTSQGTSQKKRLLTVVVGGIAGLIAVVVVLMIFNGLTSGPKNNFMALTSQQDGLYQLINIRQAKIQNSDLKKINADAQILILGTTVTLHSLLNREYGVSALPDNVIAAAGDSTIDAKLKDASLIGRYDITYRSILLGKFATQIAALQTSRSEASAFSQQKLATILDTMRSLQKQLTGLAL